MGGRGKRGGGGEGRSGILDLVVGGEERRGRGRVRACTGRRGGEGRISFLILIISDVMSSIAIRK